jgi:hypothetical protein
MDDTRSPVLKTLLFAVLILLRTFVPLGLLVAAIWWLSSGAAHHARFWWILGCVFLAPVVGYAAFFAWIAISWMREGRRNVLDGERARRERGDRRTP